MSKFKDIIQCNDDMITIGNQLKSSKKNKTICNLPYQETIADKLFEIRNEVKKGFHDSQLSFIEIEVRIGMIIDNYRRWKARSNIKSIALVDPRIHNKLNFKAGVDSIFASKLSMKLNQKSLFNQTIEPIQILRCDSLHNRWNINKLYDPSNNQMNHNNHIITSEKKDSLFQYNLGLLAHEYDIRINVATEIASKIIEEQTSTLSIKLTDPIIDYNNWNIERKKKRICYKAKEANVWKIDYTEVDVTHRNAIDGSIKKGNREYELEFELESTAMIAWLKLTDYNEVLKTTMMFTEQLIRLLDYTVPFEIDTEKETSLAIMPYDDNIEYEIASMNAIAQGMDVPNKINSKMKYDFLGCMPVNLTRRNLTDFQQNCNDYYITEKSDGIRYLLYVVTNPLQTPSTNNTSTTTRSPIALLMDRSRTLYRFRGCEAIGMSLGFGTILDGELVYNRSFKDNVYLVFDVLLWKYQSRMNYLFKPRIDLIQSEIIPEYTQQLNNYIANNNTSINSKDIFNPLLLVRKVFVTTKDLTILLNKMHIEGEEHIFYDTDRRHHKSDGLIFQPNMRYVSSKHYELLKWKWPELRSIDLQVENNIDTDDNKHPSEWQVYLMCCGPDGVPINCTKRGDTNVGLGEFDTYRLLADMEDESISKGPVIVEVSYNLQHGMWNYVKIRKDKNKPNYIDSVLGVFLEQAEAISIEELEYVLNSSLFQLDFDFESQLQKMKTKLLEWQRNELKKKIINK